MRLFFSLGLVGVGATSLAAPLRSKDKLNCTAKELARQDCRLTSRSYNIRLLAKTIAWDDGTWHTVDDMPLKGEALAWQKVEFAFMGGWPILQLWLWDKGVGETDIQSLHWFVADAEKRHFTILEEGLVRKRRPEAPPTPPEPPAPVATPRGQKPAASKPSAARASSSPPQAKFLYDAMEPHSLKILKNGNLEWHLKSEKRLIDKSQLGGKDSHSPQEEK